MSENKYENHETLAKHCKRHKLNIAHARRIMRKTGIPGVTKLMDKLYIIANDAPPIVLPELGKHTVKRADGRQRYTVYATATERNAIAKTVGAENVTDPRAVAKQKRAARKLAASNDDNDDNDE